jgi:hypothetical protein
MRKPLKAYVRSKADSGKVEGLIPLYLMSRVSIDPRNKKKLVIYPHFFLETYLRQGLEVVVTGTLTVFQHKRVLFFAVRIVAHSTILNIMVNASVDDQTNSSRS